MVIETAGKYIQVYISMLDHGSMERVRLNGWGMGYENSGYSARNGCGIGQIWKCPNLRPRPVVISVEVWE